MRDLPYFQQASLMIRAMPAVATEACFALKGGTAINLFIRSLPRLSVDLDLVYLPLQERDDSLAGINDALLRIAERMQRQIAGAEIHYVRTAETGLTYKLLVTRDGATIKIEPNLTLRGVLHPPEERALVSAAEELFEQAVTMRLVSMPDLYAGKLCAALDRQHPRDLYDVRLLLENEGISKDLLAAFVVYLASHNRPMHELLAPRRHDISEIFEREFVGMAREPVALESLIGAREQMIAEINLRLNDEHRRFLLSLKEGRPDWGLLPFDNVAALPAIQWKLQNIRNMSKAKREEQIEKLRNVLGAKGAPEHGA